MKCDVRQSDKATFEPGYNFLNVTEHFILLQTSVVITKDSVMFNGEELTGTKEYLTLNTWCRINNVVRTGVDIIQAFRREVPILSVRFTLLF